MFRKERCSYTRQHQAGKDGNGKDILLDFLAPLRFSGTEDDALDFVIYPPACFEGVRIGIGS